MTDVFHLFKVILNQSGQISLLFFFFFKLHIHFFQTYEYVLLFLYLFLGAHEYLFKIVLTTDLLFIVKWLRYYWVVEFFPGLQDYLGNGVISVF